MSTEERLAILETKQESLIQEFRKFRSDLEDHMEREEQDRANLLNRLTAIENRMAKQSGYVAGIITVVSGFWILISTAAYWVFKIKTGG